MREVPAIFNQNERDALDDRSEFGMRVNDNTTMLLTMNTAHPDYYQRTPSEFNEPFRPTTPISHRI